MTETISSIVIDLFKRTEEYHLEYEIIFTTIACLLEETELTVRDLQEKYNIQLNNVDSIIDYMDAIAGILGHERDKLKSKLTDFFTFLTKTGKVNVSQISEALKEGLIEWDLSGG